MRNIKFRVWDKEEKSMHDVCTLGLQHKICVIEKPMWKNGLKIINKSFDDIELMQYTGLKDINGVEIYEGDVVLDKYGPKINMIVKWIDDGFRTIGKYNSENYVGYIKESCEVIGNIYENPELLEDFKKGDSNGN